jgi:hypothetical protein
LAYLFLNDDSDFLNGAIELIKGNTPFVVNIEEFEAFGEVALLCLWLSTLLCNFGSEFSFEPKIVEDTYSFYPLMSLFIFVYLLYRNNLN